MCVTGLPQVAWSRDPEEAQFLILDLEVNTIHHPMPSLLPFPSIFLNCGWVCVPLGRWSACVSVMVVPHVIPALEQ